MPFICIVNIINVRKDQGYYGTIKCQNVESLSLAMDLTSYKQKNKSFIKCAMFISLQSNHRCTVHLIVFMDYLGVAGSLFCYFAS